MGIFMVSYTEGILFHMGSITSSYAAIMSSTLYYTVPYRKKPMD